jgi:hypothetical protein
VERGERKTDLIQLRVPPQSLRTLRVQITRQNPTPLLPTRNCERSHAGETIDDHVLRCEGRDEAGVFGLETGVPVDGGEVEAETTVVLGLGGRARGGKKRREEDSSGDGEKGSRERG